MRVASCELESLKARIEIQKCEFKSTSSNSRVQLYELPVQIHELRVQNLKFKNHLINENSSK